MGVQVELHNLVDLALRSPEVGVVNFNHLHTLLHAILQHIDIGKLKADLTKEGELSTLAGVQSTDNTDGENKPQPPPLEGEVQLSRNLQNELIEKTQELERKLDSLQNQLPVSQDYLQNKLSEIENKLKELADKGLHSSIEERPPSHKEIELEQKIVSLEEKLRTLDELPSNREIIEKVQSENEAGNQSTLGNMWNFMKLSNRMNAAEEAIDKLTSVVSDFLAGGKSLKDFIDDIVALKKGLEDVQNNVSAMETKIFDSGLEDKLHSLDKLQNELEKMHSFEARLNSMDQLPSFGDIGQDDMARLSNQLNSRLSGMVSKGDLSLYVTWPALEDALNIGKETGLDIGTETEEGRILSEDLKRPQSAPTVTSPETEVTSETPQPPKTAWVKSPQQTTDVEEEIAMLTEEQQFKPSPFPGERQHPSPELLECLKQIGELNEKHEKVIQTVDGMSQIQGKLANEVQEVEETLLKKADKDELQFPSDLQDQLNMLKQGLEFLNTNQDLLVLADIKSMALENQEELANIKRELARPKGTPMLSTSPLLDQDTVSAINRQLYDLRTELDRLTELCKERHNQLTDAQKQMLEDLLKKKELIDALYNYVEQLQENKADKENVAMEMNIKADKDALEGKVSMSTFDQSFNILDQGLQEALQKIDEYMNEEETLKETLKQLSAEMEGKIDSDAFATLKDYLENRVKEVQKSRVQLEQQSKMDMSQAAGLRRPLPVHYNCISCNRPVDVTLKDHAEPTLPEAERIFPSKYKHPLNPYEMDQIKHYQRSVENRIAEKAVTDLLSSRPCGGSHTVMLPHPRKQVKSTLNQILIGVEEVATRPPPFVREVSIVDFLKGSDGQVYRGRYKVLPNLKKMPSPPMDKRIRKHRLKHSPRNSYDSQEHYHGLKHRRSDSDKQILSLEDREETISTRSSPVTSARKIPRTEQLGYQFGGSAPDLSSPAPAPAPPRVSRESYRNIAKQEKQDHDIDYNSNIREDIQVKMADDSTLT